jgi:1-acyl-sn-glycerol-3-phosphate acyltransferase
LLISVPPRSRPPFTVNPRVHEVTRRPVSWFFRLVSDLRITGREHIPAESRAVIAGNHLSHIDPPVISLAAPRNVRYLALDELFGKTRLFDWITLYYEAIPMSRTRAPLGAMREAIATLEGDGLLGVFPEGRRVAAWGEVYPPKRGAAWLAMRTGSPLVPVAVQGTQGTLSIDVPGLARTAVRVWVEPPLLPEDYLDRIDPIGAMMDDWYRALDRRLGMWQR